MPELIAEIEQVAAVVARQHPAFGVEVRDVGDIGAQPHLGAGIVRIDLERAEQLAEGELLFVGHRLLGEDEDAVAVEGRFDLGKDAGRHRPREVDPAHFGAEGRVKRSYLYRHVCCPEKARYRNMSRDSKTINSASMSTCEIKEIADWLIDGARSAPQPAQVLGAIIRAARRLRHPAVAGRSVRAHFAPASHGPPIYLAAGD